MDSPLIQGNVETPAKQAAQPAAGGDTSRLVIRGETNLDKPYKYRVHDGWAELLARYPWQWFVNLTFTEDIHPESALKSFRT